MTIKITFNPQDSEVADIFSNDTARKLWCLWRRGHIVSQYFNDAVVEIAKRIDGLPFITVQGLIDCFQCYLYHDFKDNDVAKFVGEHVFYFSDPLSYPITIKQV